MRYTIKDRSNGSTVADGVADLNVRLFEGNLYFDPAQVDQARLIVTDRLYTCPYKGTCNWIDLVTENGRAQSVGWVYPNPKPGYEFIKDQIAFYNRETSGTVVVTEG